MTSEFQNKHFVFLIGYISQLGGAERQALLLAKMLREQEGARVSFLAWSKAPGIMTDHLEKANIDVHVHPLDWDHRLTWRKSPLAKGARLAGFTRFVRNKVRPDFLLPYVAMNSKIAGLIWKPAGARYTWWNQRDEGRQIYGSRVDRWVLNHVPDVVSNSWDGRDFLVETCGVPYDRIRIINNAVVIPRATDGSEWRARLGLSDDDRLGVMVANFTQYKDHDTLLRAFAKAGSHSERKRFHLALAGRLDETALILKALAFDLGLGGHVHFVGPVADVDPFYEAADLLVHSSFTEGCPNAVLEGMAHSRCVVGTDIAGLRQALGEDSEAFLAPPRNVEVLAQKIGWALLSDDIRREAGAANRARIEVEFNPGRHKQAVLDGIRRYALPA